MSTGELSKMTLVGYKDSKFTAKTGANCEVLINPESYSISYELNLNQKSAQGSSVPVVKYNKGSVQTLTFKFLFDGTGVIQKNSVEHTPPRDVAEDITNFKKVVYAYQSGEHQPPYVQIKWGNLFYKCRLSKMTINYKLFKPDGAPLRAEADCTFVGIVDEETLAKIESKRSPDLTHIQTVKAGDTLSLLCYREYGDSKYYYQVAKFNGLIDIKQLAPGMKIFFPPVITN